jgi:cytidine deaminase
VFRVDGKLSIDEVNELLDVELPDEEWDTVGGLMLGLLGSIPDEGEEVSFRNLRFTAERVDGRRISKVLITHDRGTGGASRMSAPAERVDELLAAARDAMERGSYAPYSNFNVGAAVLAEGDVFAGANVENASYPMSVCAERNAVAAAVNAGKRSIDAVAVVTRAGEPTPPCGGCRQVLNEFGPDMTVTVESGTGERAEWRLTEILPHAFGPPNLGK